MTIYYEKRKIHQEGFEQGIEQGIEQGLERGEQKAKVEMVYELIHFMTDTEISTITKLPIQRVAQLREEATTAQ